MGPYFWKIFNTTLRNREAVDVYMQETLGKETTQKTKSKQKTKTEKKQSVEFYAFLSFLRRR